MASENRILTTHVGSLVRPDDFAALLRRRMDGKVNDREYLPALRGAVNKVAAEQVAAGVDIVSDGEYGKGIGWEQYVLERLSGFGPRLQLATEGGIGFGDFARFKEFYSELWPKEGYLEGIFPCVGPIKYTGHAALQRDIDNLKDAMAAAGATAGFLPVAAPASAFSMSPNDYYKTDEEYMFAGAEALPRVQRNHRGRIVRADRRRAPAVHARPHGSPASETEFQRWAHLRVDALNHALRGLPEDKIATTSAGVAGTARTRATYPSKKTSRISSGGTREPTRSKPRTRVTSTNGRCGRPSCYRRTRSDPGRDQPSDERRQHPDLVAENFALCDIVGAIACWREQTAASRRARSCAACIHRSNGRNFIARGGISSRPRHCKANDWGAWQL
jgi:methionine synthase II (cobalamin-independent)